MVGPALSVGQEGLFPKKFGEVRARVNCSNKCDVPWINRVPCFCRLGFAGIFPIYEPTRFPSGFDFSDGSVGYS